MVLERELIRIPFAPDVAQCLVEDHLERLVEAELVIDVAGGRHDDEPDRAVRRSGVYLSQ